MPVAGLVQVKVPCRQHKLVALALLETYVRYSRVFAQNSQALPPVLETFLGDTGIAHTDEVCILACAKKNSQS